MRKDYYSYFRVFINGITELDRDPVKSVLCFDRFITFLASRPHPPLRPSVATFSLVCELELVVGVAVLLRLMGANRAYALLPASYVALLNFVSTLTQHSAMMQCLQVMAPSRKTENFVIERLVRCINSLTGNVSRRFNMLGTALKVSESSVMGGEMDRMLVLALVFLVNSGSDGLLPDKCAQRMCDSLRYRATLVFNNKQDTGWKPTKRVHDALESVCAMQGRHDAIQILRGLLTARDDEYLYVCSWRADRVMVGINFQTINRLEMFGNCQYAATPVVTSAPGAAGSRPITDEIEDEDLTAAAEDGQTAYDELVTAEDDQEFLKSVAQQDAAAESYEDANDAGIRLQSESTYTMQQSSTGGSVTELLVSLLASNERGCAVCGVDFMQEDWNAELDSQNWMDDDYDGGKGGGEEDQLRQDEAERRRQVHESCVEHSEAVANYHLFQIYCNKKAAALPAVVHSAIAEVRNSMCSRYAVDEMLRGTVETALGSLEEAREDLLATIRDATVNHHWHKLDDVRQMVVQLEQQLSRVQNEIADSFSVAERVRLAKSVSI